MFEVRLDRRGCEQLRKYVKRLVFGVNPQNIPGLQISKISIVFNSCFKIKNGNNF